MVGSLERARGVEANGYFGVPLKLPIRDMTMVYDSKAIILAQLRDLKYNA